MDSISLLSLRRLEVQDTMSSEWVTATITTTHEALTLPLQQNSQIAEGDCTGHSGCSQLYTVL